MPIIPIAALAISAAGAVSAADGARKSLHAQQDAAATNNANVNNTNQVNYVKWLATQGIGDNGQPQNTWLPRYATVNDAAGSGSGAPVAGMTPQFSATPNTSTAMPTAAPMAGFGGAAPAAGGRSWAGLGINR